MVILLVWIRFVRFLTSLFSSNLEVYFTSPPSWPARNISTELYLHWIVIIEIYALVPWLVNNKYKVLNAQFLTLIILLEPALNTTLLWYLNSGPLLYSDVYNIQTLGSAFTIWTTKIQPHKHPLISKYQLLFERDLH